MSFDTQKLYDLLPAVVRMRDAESGGPLRALLSVIADQAAVLEEDLDQLLDDLFIETCADWVVLYIGDLIGYRPLHGVGAAVSSPRAEVANTIGYRRRKGTVGVLEQLARDVTGWHAKATEFFTLLVTAQSMNHIRRGHAFALDLRRAEPLVRLNTPFDPSPRTVDVRRIASGEGRYNIPNVGLFLWRLDASPLTDSPAVPEGSDVRRFRFSPLGIDAPLFTRPEAETEISHLAGPLNVPEPIRRRAMDSDVAAYYGEDRSIQIRTAGGPVAADRICVCDLSDAGAGWAHQPKGKVAIDPVLGRLAFGPDLPPPANVRVSFHHGLGADTGGGEYERRASFADANTIPNTVVMPAKLQPALDAAKDGGVVEVQDSGRYTEALSVAVNAGKRLEVRAANHNRPTLALASDLQIRGGTDAEVSLNGLLIVGRKLIVPAASSSVRLLRLRHCTLVPGLELSASGDPKMGAEPSLVADVPNLQIEIEDCIVGGLRVTEGAQVRVKDSIIDAIDQTGVAFAALDHQSAGGVLTVESSTIVGKVNTVELALASNAIFLARLLPADTWPAPIRSERRQAGCVRFSFLPLSALVPRRHRCQPDLEIATLVEKAEKSAGGAISTAQRQAIRTAVEAWLVPAFTSLRYGRPGYGQLRPTCPEPIRTGADDESEMGAFHKVFAPQRATNLRVRLDEYLRLGLEAGVFYAT